MSGVLNVIQFQVWFLLNVILLIQIGARKTCSRAGRDLCDKERKTRPEDVDGRRA